MNFIKVDDVVDTSVPELFRTALPQLDKAGFFRMKEPDLIFLGGRPGSGKTLLGLQIAHELSLSGTVLVFSLEMTKEQLKLRLRKNVNFDPAVSQLFICDKGGIHIDEIVAMTTDFHEKREPISLVLVDYTQIVGAEGRTKAEEVGEVVAKLKELAKYLNVPVLALAQLNRDIEKREKEAAFVEPTMSDFADSASIEKFADCTLIIHRKVGGDGETVLYCPKFRHGESNQKITLRLNRKQLKFEETEGAW